MPILNHPVTITAITLLTRLTTTLCTIILLLHAIDTTTLRHTTQPPSTTIQKLSSDLPFNISTDLIRQDLHRLTHSRWLGVHVWLVYPWLFLAFTQSSSTLRRTSLNLHAALGKLFLAVSIVMTFGQLMIFITGETILGSTDFCIDFNHPEKFFTFRAGSLVFTAWWMICMYNIYKSGMRRSIRMHRYWTYQFLATGFGVGTARVYIGFAYMFGFPLSGDVSLTKHVQDVIMGYSLWLGFTLNCLIVHLWTRYTERPVTNAKHV